jgi:hypothetical protein
VPPRMQGQHSSSMEQAEQCRPHDSLVRAKLQCPLLVQHCKDWDGVWLEQISTLFQGMQRRVLKVVRPPTPSPLQTFR